MEPVPDAYITSVRFTPGIKDGKVEVVATVAGKAEGVRVGVRAPGGTKIRSGEPGKPFVFGQAAQKFLFGLPGNPVSALVAFQLLVRPALAAMQGATDLSLPRLTGVLTESLVNPANRRHFMRVVMDDAGQVRSAGTQASHSLSSLAKANGLVDVPPESDWPAGAAVTVLRLDW